MRKKGVLWYVFVGSRGGETRTCIMESLLEKPKNPRQLAIDLDMDYSTIRHSLRVLKKNRLVFSPNEDDYGAEYQPSPEFAGMRERYEEIKKTCTKRDTK